MKTYNKTIDLFKKLNKLKVPLYHFAIIDSTNEEAKRRAYLENNFTGVIISETQTHGKGRNGRKWFSADTEGLYYTLAIQPKYFDFKELPNLVKNIGYQVIKVVKNITDLDLYLEWPNDLILNQRKVGGILIETILIPFQPLPKNLIIGIGLNINQKEFPDDLRYSATSLYLNSQIKYKKDPFIINLTTELLKIL